ncbi:MAG TPA: response regulator [Paucimonas sp.]|nr:response regulator [Paucimonas sp.]
MPGHVLIIEDNPANMELMVYLLNAFGHQVSAIYDGAAGIDAAQRSRPDLIICDVHLPKMDGYEIVRRLKTDPKLAGVPVVAVTALAMVGDQEKLLNAGFDSYIGKPIDPEAFVGQIEKLLGIAPAANGRQGAPPGLTPANDHRT